MKYIDSIVKDNKVASKKKAVIKKAKKYKPLLIVYKGKPPLCDSMLFACLPEDEESLLNQIGEEMSDKTSYKRIIITEKSKSMEGWLLHIRAVRPALTL